MNINDVKISLAGSVMIYIRSNSLLFIFPVCWSLPPTRQDLTQGQWSEGRLLRGLREGKVGLESKLEPCLTLLVIIAHPRVSQRKPGAFRPWIYSWLTQHQAEAQPPRLSFLSVLCISRTLFRLAYWWWLPVSFPYWVKGTWLHCL